MDDTQDIDPMPEFCVPPSQAHSHLAPCNIQGITSWIAYFHVDTCYQGQGLFFVVHKVCLSCNLYPVGFLFSGPTQYTWNPVWQAFRDVKIGFMTAQVKQTSPLLLIVPQLLEFQVHTTFPGVHFWMWSFGYYFRTDTELNPQDEWTWP